MNFIKTKIIGPIWNFLYTTRSRKIKLMALPDKFENPLDVIHLAQHQILTDQEVEKLKRQVFEDQHLWRKRNSVMFSIGAPIYNLYSKGSAYYDELTYWHDLLFKNYGWLYNKILAEIQNRLPEGESVCYHEKVGLPGFHIFQLDSWSQSQPAFPHYDTPYSLLDFDFFGKNPMYGRALSFTIAINLPKVGSGMYIVNEETEPIWMKLMPSLLKWLLRKKFYIEHREGWAVFQPGSILHYIAPLKPSQASIPEWRITLQGHGLYFEDQRKWLLYW